MGEAVELTTDRQMGSGYDDERRRNPSVQRQLDSQLTRPLVAKHREETVPEGYVFSGVPIYRLLFPDWSTKVRTPTPLPTSVSREAVGPRHTHYCNACYTREYPVEPPPDAEADTHMVFTRPNSGDSIAS